MRTSFKTFLSGLSLLAIQIKAVRSHAVIVAVAGDNGVTGAGFGMVSSVPRDGTDEQPFQIDTSVFKNVISDPCGSTLAGGSVNIANSLAAAEKAGNGQLPALTDDMVVSLTLHQVNGDGGGPFSAMFNTDGTGKKWQNATVVTQAPGENGLLAGGPYNSLFEAQLPTGTKCTGGANGDACLVRVTNGGAAVGAGPFGGCLAVQMPSGTGGNSTTGGNTGNTGNRNGRNRNNQRLQRSNDVSQLKRQIRRLVRRLSISPSEANDLITAAGSALNVPIDLLAGQDDASPNGGNSTTAKNAVLTVKQAEALKASVKDAVSKAIEMMATGAVTPTAGAIATQVNSNPDLAITRNQEMTASFSSSLATFVSEAVGQPAGTAIATATATATGGAGATKTSAAATATATSTRGNGNGRNRNGNNNGNGNNTGNGNGNGSANGANRNQNQNQNQSQDQDQNNRNGANGNNTNQRGNNKRDVQRPRVRSRVMRDIVFDEQW